MDYYKQKQIIAHVNDKDEILGQVEKWDAHKKGILHRAFSVVLKYKNSYIMQVRKHPAFDGFIDVTASSHPIFKDTNIQPNLEAVYECLQREWNINKEDYLYEPKNLGYVIYKTDDLVGGFIEHELCYLYISEVKQLPQPNFDVAYGFILLTEDELKNSSSKITSTLAPWVKEFIEKKLL